MNKMRIIIIFSILIILLIILLISFISSSISSSIISYMSTDIISDNCEDGLSGVWVPLDSCSNVITNDNCPEKSVVNHHEDNYKEDNQSDGFFDSIFDFFSFSDKSKKLIRCYDCSRGLEGDWVKKDCMSVITDDTCPEIALDKFMKMMI